MLVFARSKPLKMQFLIDRDADLDALYSRHKVEEGYT